jgi:hypothetical protein
LTNKINNLSSFKSSCAILRRRAYERISVVVTNYHIISNAARIKEKAARYMVLVGSFSDKAKALKTSRVIFKKEKLKSVIYKY